MIFNTYTEPLLTALIVLGLLVVYRLPRGRGRRAAMVAMWGFFAVSWPPIEWLISYPLEGHFPVRPVPLTPKPQAIVVQSAGVNMIQFERPYQLPDFDTFQRCWFAAWLHSRWPDLPVVASGGGSAPQASATIMRDLLVSQGVPAEQILTDEASHSTYESARATARILKQRGIKKIALVVEGQSMLRAAACFRKQGIDVMPTPCEIRQFGQPWQEELLPTWRAIRRNEMTLHEAGGLIWYWIKGWI